MSPLPLFLSFLLITSFAENDPSKLNELLSNQQISIDDLGTEYIPLQYFQPEVAAHGLLSREAAYDAEHIFPPKNAFNHLIGSIKDDEIEVILSDDDLELTQQLVDGFESETANDLNGIDLDRYHQFIDEMISLESPSVQKKLKEKKHYKPSPFDHNGASSDLRLFKSKTPSTGLYGDHWSVSDRCIRPKGCSIYPIFRVIHRSKSSSNPLSFSCRDIHSVLMPQIYECVDRHGVDQCPLIIGHGHFRWVFKALIPDDHGGDGTQFVAIKMMKASSGENARDLLRHLRESIFLYYLRNEELQFIHHVGADSNLLFKSNLGEQRAFPFVHELGHCLHPSYISVSHYHAMNIEQFIDDNLAAKAPLSRLMAMSLDIAKGIELMHSIRGGPYHHTDIRSDQFLIDEHGHVLLNDFNRGKFQQYLFPRNTTNDEGDGDNNKNAMRMTVRRCAFCPHSAHGMGRAPEEHRSENLDETIDVYSAAMVIWGLFSGTEPFIDIDGMEGAAVYVIHDTARRPKMPSNMPFAMKQIINAALCQDPRRRPSAKEMVNVLRSVYQEMNELTRNKGNVTSEILRQKRAFHDARYPRVSADFPEFVGKSGSG